MKKLSLLLIVLMSFVRIGFGQVFNISTGVDASSTVYTPGTKDLQWKMVAPSPVTGNPFVELNPLIGTWNPSPVTGTSAQWIGSAAKPSGQTAGIYTFERTIVVTPATGIMDYNFMLAVDDDLVGVEIQDPSANITDLKSKFILTKGYYLSKPITGTISCPAAGKWILRVKVNFIDGLAAFMVSGNVALKEGGNCGPIGDFTDTKCCTTENQKNLSTGFGNSANSLIANGMADDDWKITSTPSGAAIAMVATSATVSPSYAPASSKAQWLLAKGKSDIGSFTFERTIVVPAGMEANLSFSRIGGDNEVEMSLISGANTTQIYKSNFPGPVGGLAFKPTNAILKSCKVSQRLAPGTHKIVCTVSSNGGDAGLLVEGCYELVQTVPECRCPAGWLSNSTGKDGDITTDGKCKKLACGPSGIKPPKNGTEIGPLNNPWGFTWGGEFWAWGSKENGGAPICTLNGKVIDWSAYQATQGRGE
jgi:hypothetical protein